MNIENIRLLVVEDSPYDARYLKEVLANHASTSARIVRFEVIWADRLETGLAHLARAGADVAFLDLSLPDASGLEAVTRTRAAAPDLAIVVLTGQRDEETGVRALQEGAQEYLIKGDCDKATITRAAIYAMERAKLLSDLRGQSIRDPLTGLLNRRGFLDIGARHLAWVARVGRSCVAIFADLDGLKTINDQFGHAEGDAALAAAAAALRSSFRESDVVARIGGDEFAVLATSTTRDSQEFIRSRLLQKVAEFNAESGRPWRLGMSLGMIPYERRDPCAIEVLLERADRQMYREKGKKRPMPAEGGEADPACSA
ncbi:MAG: diguanylate cyclase [Planctomycetes bacterium]|nr:diguanylate cyclase [Planctomycetota bacterium]